MIRLSYQTSATKVTLQLDGGRGAVGRRRSRTARDHRFQPYETAEGDEVRNEAAVPISVEDPSQKEK